MSRICPGCGIVIPHVGGLKVTLREKGDVWYRRSPRRFYCKNCGRQLRVVIKPVGHLLNAMIASSFLGCLAYIMWYPPVSLYQLIGTGLSAIAVIAVLTVCFQAWGVRFALIERAP